jgi:BioD-like phosphotransacetylase family protein
VNLGIPVAMIPHETLRAIERIERLFGKSGLTQAASLTRLEALMERYFDFKRFYERMGLTPGQPVP